MPSRTPRYQVRVTNEHEDRGIPCATMEECMRVASQGEGTISIYDFRRNTLRFVHHEVRQDAPAPCDACDGAGLILYGGNEVPCDACSHAA